MEYYMQYVLFSRLNFYLPSISLVICENIYENA